MQNPPTKNTANKNAGLASALSNKIISISPKRIANGNKIKVRILKMVNCCINQWVYCCCCPAKVSIIISGASDPSCFCNLTSVISSKTCPSS